MLYLYISICFEDAAAKPPDEAELLFRCRLGALGRPRIGHKLDVAMKARLDDRRFVCISGFQ